MPQLSARSAARLDGMPLAIELAAARVRALSLTEILDSLHDRFRLLTGGARTAVRRQQTLASLGRLVTCAVDRTERMLFRRLGVFLGGFDLRGCPSGRRGDAGAEQHQVLDQLSLLVDKSLVVAENVCGRMRYRLLETVRQYALEKLGESGDADTVRDRHRDHYTDMAADLASSVPGGVSAAGGLGRRRIDNLRAAFARSRENGDVDRRCGSHPRCNRSGSLVAAYGKDWTGSTPPSPTRPAQTWRPRSGCARWCMRNPRGVAGHTHQPVQSAGRIVDCAGFERPNTDRDDAQRLRRSDRV